MGFLLWMIEESEVEVMKKNPDMSVRVRCHKCKKIFEVNLVKEQDIPDGKMVEKRQSCPYCGEDNIIVVPENTATPDTMHREIKEAKVVEGRKV